MSQLTNRYLKGQIIDLGGSLPPSVELDIHRWLQDSEEALCKQMTKEAKSEENVGCISLLNKKLNIHGWLQDADKVMKEDNQIMDRRREKMKFWVSTVMGLYTRMVCCSILSFVILKSREEDKRF